MTLIDAMYGITAYFSGDSQAGEKIFLGAAGSARASRVGRSNCKESRGLLLLAYS